jgi:hypothetical protein
MYYTYYKVIMQDLFEKVFWVGEFRSESSAGFFRLEDVEVIQADRVAFFFFHPDGL